MRYFVPTRIQRTNFNILLYADPYYVCSSGDESPYGYCIQYLCAGDVLEEVKDPSFFFQTHDREFNDCVHAKPVDSDGNKLGVPALDRYGQYCLLSTRTGRGPWSQYVDNKHWIWGTNGKIVNGSTTTHHYTYGCTISRRYNTGYDLVMSFPIWVLDARVMKWYTRGKTWQYRISDTVEIRFSCKVKETVPKVSRTIYVDSATVVNDPYGTDFSLVISAVSALIENVKFVYVPSWQDFACVEDYHVWEQIVDVGMAKASELWKDIPSHSYSGVASKSIVYEAAFPIDFGNPESRFQMHEPDIIARHTDPYLVTAGQDTSQYFWNVLVQQAYLDALSSVPRLNDNSISNIIEIAAFIKALVIDHRIEIPKSLSDVWLSYRYQYTTTKLDAEEAIDFVHRHLSLGTLEKWVSCYGRSQVSYNGIDITCRCGLDIRPKEVAYLQKIWRALYTYGLQPDFYIIWDMIPYSFIVDWFLPIGKLASVADARRNYNETYYEIENVIFSFSYDVPATDDGIVKYHCYTRFLSPGVVTLNGFYFFEEDPVSSRVIGYRIFDTLALILGRR